MAQAVDEINQARLEIEESLIDAYGNTVTLRSEGTKSYDEWGEPILTGQADVVTIGVTDNYITKRFQFTSGGRLAEGESIVIIKAGETVDETYTILVDSVEYNITSIENLKAADVVVAVILTVASK